jgi:hypothetical protein
MARKERMEARQRIDVLEPLVGSRGRVPLVVTFGIDAYEEMHLSVVANPRSAVVIDPDPSPRA